MLELRQLCAQRATRKFLNQHIFHEEQTCDRCFAESLLQRIQKSNSKKNLIEFDDYEAYVNYWCSVCIDYFGEEEYIVEESICKLCHEISL